MFGSEIYNDNVRDLLNSDFGRTLKLLDDPEVIYVNVLLLGDNNLYYWNFSVFLWMQKGTMVEKLVEETTKDYQHLRQLISIYEGKSSKPVAESLLSSSEKHFWQTEGFVLYLCYAIMAL